MRSIRIILAVFSAASLAALEACAGGAAGPAPLGASGGTGTMAWADHRMHPQDVPVLGGCQVFPADNPWNTDISQAPVDPNSDNYMAAMHASTTNLHPDFGLEPALRHPGDARAAVDAVRTHEVLPVSAAER